MYSLATSTTNKSTVLSLFTRASNIVNDVVKRYAADICTVEEEEEEEGSGGEEEGGPGEKKSRSKGVVTQVEVVRNATPNQVFALLKQHGVVLGYDEATDFWRQLEGKVGEAGATGFKGLVLSSFSHEPIRKDTAMGGECGEKNRKR